jgi:hypothetical protein
MAAKFGAEDHTLALTANGATVRFDSLEVTELRSMWLGKETRR